MVITMDKDAISTTLLSIIIVVVFVMGTIVLLRVPVSQKNDFVPGIGGGPERSIPDYPERFIGQTITVEGNVERVLSNKILIMETTETMHDDKVPILIQGKSEMSSQFRPGDHIRVIGTVRTMTTTETEHEYDPDFAPDVKTKINNRPIIIATEIALIAER